MIFSTHQPYFCPYPGYFAKAMNSHVFVILDSVQFPRGGTWITRNRFKNDQGIFWIGMPVWKKGRGLQKINEVMICREGRTDRKRMESLKTAYAQAPYLEEHLPLFERVFSGRYESIGDVDVEIIRYAAGCLGIPARIVLLSDLGILERGTSLIISLCAALGASEYLAFSSARTYLDEDLFRRAGIGISFINPPAPVYPQLWGDFIHNLSIFDLLFTCGPKARDIMVKAAVRGRSC
jgi:hypothetical protein